MSVKIETGIEWGVRWPNEEVRTTNGECEAREIARLHRGVTAVSRIVVKAIREWVDTPA